MTSLKGNSDMKHCHIKSILTIIDHSNKLCIIINNWVIVEPKRTSIHPLNRRCVAVKNSSNLLLNSCIFSNLFIVLGNLFYNFLPTFALLFLKRVVLQNWVWRSDFWHVQCSCTFSLYFIFSVFDFTQHITLYADKQRKYIQIFKKISGIRCWLTLPIILKTFFCNQKIIILSGSPPHRVKPYLKWTWKNANTWFLRHMDSLHSLRG